MPGRLAPDDPREWLNRARSSLVHAKVQHPEVYLEELCFDAQQAAEKAIKALLIKHNVEFPYVHDLARLLKLVEDAGEQVPERVRQVHALTRFAVLSRYPGLDEQITREEYDEAIALAEEVVRWAEQCLS